MADLNKLAILGGLPLRKTPFPSWPVFDGGEEQALLGVLRSGSWWSGSQAYTAKDAGSDASRVNQFEVAFAGYHQAAFGLACASGTAALEVVLKAAGIGPGDEVIVPPYTFLATASAPLLVGAIPVFCDIEPDTFNLDPRRLEEAITPRTRAIIPVHFAGLAANMHAILAIAKKHNLFVLEDAAHAHGASLDGRFLGTWGNAGIFSFQASKNMSSGEGGLILTSDPELADMCNSYIWAGRIVGRPWYEHHRLGWNYRLTEFQAAILTEQLKRLPQQTATRMRNGLHLNGLMRQIPGVAPLSVPDGITGHSFHLYIFRFDAEVFGISRKTFLDALQAEGIPCSPGYGKPLYQNPLFLENNFNANGVPITVNGPVDYARFAALCPVAEKACLDAVWIEHRVLLDTMDGVEDVARAVEKIYQQREALASYQASAEARELQNLAH
jgi:dTDP-4-amino-4,6-dideoxygalactose transaminase